MIAATNLYSMIEGATGVPSVIQAAILAGLLLMLSGVVMRRQLAAAGDGGLVPDAGFTIRNSLELLVESIAGLSKDIIGNEWRRFMPLIVTLFLFIVLSNLMGLIPALGGATSFPTTTWAWAIISFLVYNAVGIARHKHRYILQFCGPSFDLSIGGRKYHFPVLFFFFLPLELPLHFARMLTLSIRLLANMYADHLVVATWLGLAPFLVPVAFLGLGSLVAVIQAFVFTLLTMTYIGSALEEPH